MTRYLLLISDDEATWQATTAEERDRVFAQHEKFQKALAERGMTIVDGAELTASREGRTVRHEDGRLVVTDGPYTESAEQIAGFYLVESDDYDALTEVAGELTLTEDRIEIRPMNPGMSS